MLAKRFLPPSTKRRVSAMHSSVESAIRETNVPTSTCVNAAPIAKREAEAVATRTKAVAADGQTLRGGRPRICKYYLRGECRKTKEQCEYDHPALCRYYPKGACTRGKGCPFAHLRNASPASRPTTPEPRATSGNGTEGTADGNEGPKKGKENEETL